MSGDLADNKMLVALIKVESHGKLLRDSLHIVKRGKALVTLYEPLLQSSLKPTFLDFA